MKSKVTLKSLLAASALVWATMGSAVAGELTYGSPFPENHVLHSQALKPFFERIADETNGSVTWKMLVGGAMGGPLEALNIVKNQIVDSSVIMDLYMRADLPVSSAVADLFVVADDLLVFAAASNETFLVGCDQCKAELDRHNILGLAYYASGPYVLMCREPVTSLEDLQGKKVRASTRMGALMQHMGATPVSITSSEMYEAIQRGQADCTVGGAAWLESYNLKDVISSVVEEPLGVYYSGLFMNLSKGAWQGLSEDERAVIRRNLSQLTADAIFGDYEEGLKAIGEATAAGAKVYGAPEDFKRSLAQFRSGEFDYAVSKAKEAGVDDPEALLKMFLENVEKWRAIVAQTGPNKEAYRDALEREIFSKL